MVVDPKNLGSLRVKVVKEKYDRTPMTAAEHAKSIEEDRKEVRCSWERTCSTF
jgi:hypothetical protein